MISQDLTTAEQVLLITVAASVALDRVAQLEALIAEQEFCATGHDPGITFCPVCSGEEDSKKQHEPDCPWGEAAANHRNRNKPKTEEVPTHE